MNISIKSLWEAWEEARVAIIGEDIVRLQDILNYAQQQWSYPLVKFRLTEWNSKTLLCEATDLYVSNIHIIKILLDCGSDPNAIDDDGKSPLDYARGSEAISLLRLYGAKHGLMTRTVIVYIG